jgi:poly(3-hydroxybutyrate) depolymerase
VARGHLSRFARPAALVLALLAGVVTGDLHAAPPGRPDLLPALGIDAAAVSVSGISSGGYMALQYHVAHAASIMGAGILAGGPYACAGDGFPWNLLTVYRHCMDMPGPIPFLGPPNVNQLVATTRARADRGSIDDPAELRRARVYLFSGSLDRLVPFPVMEAARQYYAAFLPADAIHFETGVAAAHAMVTLAFGNACETSDTPFINDCDYDAAGNLLQQIYGPLRPPVPAEGRVVAFDQRPFATAADGLAVTGYLYVPAACSGAGAGHCRLHVAFHGCQQTAAMIGDAFYRDAGYNGWAEANAIVVLYPQAAAVTRSFLGLTLPWPNPMACWDWWGFTGSDYALQSGRQIAAVKAMVDRLAAAP